MYEVRKYLTGPTKWMSKSCLTICCKSSNRTKWMLGTSTRTQVRKDAILYKNWAKNGMNKTTQKYISYQSSRARSSKVLCNPLIYSIT
jgi:hypothetical protein